LAWLGKSWVTEGDFLALIGLQTLQFTISPFRLPRCSSLNRRGTFVDPSSGLINNLGRAADATGGGGLRRNDRTLAEFRHGRGDLIPFALLYLIAVGIVWLTHLSPARPFFASCIGIAGPFFASVVVLFSLFAAFLANEVQHVQAEAKAAVFREADGIRTILRLAEALGGTVLPARHRRVG
jgi:hypothetical protein